MKVEDSIVGNRVFMEAVINDLRKVFGYRRYTEKDSLITIQRKEGKLDVVEYLQRKYIK